MSPKARAAKLEVQSKKRRQQNAASITLVDGLAARDDRARRWNAATPQGRLHRKVARTNRSPDYTRYFVSLDATPLFSKYSRNT
jgi:hypothetical protein